MFQKRDSNFGVGGNFGFCIVAVLVNPIFFNTLERLPTIVGNVVEMLKVKVLQNFLGVLRHVERIFGS